MPLAASSALRATWIHCFAAEALEEAAGRLMQMFIAFVGDDAVEVARRWPRHCGQLTTRCR